MENVNITEEQVSKMVDQFYEKIFRHPRLGPIFREHMSGGHAAHLDTMKKFWRSVLLQTREYNGRPVPAHQKIEGVTTDHFREWLSMFHETTRDLFDEEVRAEINIRAERIATSLWLVRNTDPFATPPIWRSSGTDSDAGNSQGDIA